MKLFPRITYDFQTHQCVCVCVTNKKKIDRKDQEQPEEIGRKI